MKDGIGRTPSKIAVLLKEQHQNRVRDKRVVSYLKTKLAHAHKAQDISAMTSLDKKGWPWRHKAVDERESI